jgi:deoxyribonuclease-4
VNLNIIGAHVSIAGGISNAPQRGLDIGCDAIQIFTKNQVQWKEPSLSEDEICSFEEEYNRAKLKSLIVHCSYLINLASPKANVYSKSLRAFVCELKRSEKIGANYVVIHPGAHMGDGEEKGLGKIVKSVNRALETSNTKNVCVLYETTAGAGTVLGYRFEQIANLIENCSNSRRVGVCLDTCHVFAAGYDLRTSRGYGKTMREFDDIIGLEKLKVIHMNDSKTELGSRVDRHHHIGEGFIGLKGFRNIVRDERLKTIPKILETPGMPDDFRRNIKLLRSLND